MNAAWMFAVSWWWTAADPRVVDMGVLPDEVMAHELVRNGALVLRPRVQPTRVGDGELVVLEGEVDGVPLVRPLGAWVRHLRDGHIVPATSLRLPSTRRPGAMAIADGAAAVAEVVRSR